jgi:hypothetical protein
MSINPKMVQASAASRVLLIPCHLPGHWALAVRVVQLDGIKKIYIMDSTTGCSTKRGEDKRHISKHSNLPI